MTKQNTIWTACGSCDRDTKHEIIFSVKEPDDDYSDRLYQIVECCGCETKSFRKVIIDYHNAYQIDEDEWKVPEDISSYPAVLKGHQALPGIYRAPRLVREIYGQSLDAIKNQFNVLAGIGLRATIEAICQERQVRERNLDAKIDKLAKSGFISKNDADRLHAIRFLGNDAAHEIQATELEGLLAALRIVEHLIVSVYILDKDADGILETLIKTYEQFEILLKEKIAEIPSGAEFPLFKYLGKDARRFHGYLKTHETKLITNITSGVFTDLSLGKHDTFVGSKEKFQHYIRP
jgi:DNA-binding Lrp family transcriptional regulator